MTRKFWKGIIIGLLLIFGQNTFAATTELGLGDTFKYSLISVGDILKVPEGATGCTIHDNSIPGTLDLDEQVGADTLGVAVLDDDCSANLTANWTIVDATLTFDTDHYVITETAGSQWFEFTAGVVTVAGTLYKVSLDFHGGTSGSDDNITVYLSDERGPGGNIIGAASLSNPPAAWNSHSWYGTATATTDFFSMLLQLDAGETVFVKNILIEPVISSTTGIFNTWITTVDPAGLNNTEPVWFANCAFVESEAVIEAKNAADVLYFDDECQFSINTADCFRDYASADYHLTSGSPLKDAGEDTGADVDLEGRITPIGPAMDIGALELRRSGGSMGMGMGLRGNFCPYRDDN